MNPEINKLRTLADNMGAKLLPVMENLTKKDVYVVVDTPKKAKKLKKLLDMFGEEVYEETNKRLSNKEVSNEYPNVHFLFTGEWIGDCRKEGIPSKKVVSIKQLRNILAKEHLKRGDICIFYDIQGYYTDVFEEICQGVFEGQFDGEKGIYTHFKRYATPEEIALLEPKPKELEVGKWYKSKNSKHLYHLVETKKGTNPHLAYGFNGDGKWSDIARRFLSIDEFSEATPQEVESALIKEAIKRGHKYDVYSWNHEQNTLYGNRGNDVGHDILFENGVWSDVKEFDKFAELKEAHKNGAVIQWRREIDGRCVWKDCHENDTPTWNYINEYRIKPEEKPKVGDVCKFYSLIEKDFIIGILGEIINMDCGLKFKPKGLHGWFLSAKPLTPQQVQELLFRKEASNA